MWNDLTLQQKAEIMKMSVANGVTDINSIRQLYDGSVEHKFSRGGPKKKKQGVDYHTNKAQAFIDELVAAGARPVDAMAVAGNVWTESRFNHEASNNINGGHWGLVQNDANIKRHIIKYYGDYSRNSQMQFLKDGLTGQIRGAKQAPWLQNRFTDYKRHTKDVTDASIAARYFHDDYERSKNEAVPDRMKAAAFYQTGIASNPSIAAYNRVYKSPNLSMSSDIFYHPVQGIQWETPIQQPIQQPSFNATALNAPMEMALPKIEMPKIIPIEERVPISDELPDITPLFSYLPDQPMSAQPKVTIPEYRPIDLGLSSPYLLFRG